MTINKLKKLIDKVFENEFEFNTVVVEDDDHISFRRIEENEMEEELSLNNLEKAIFENHQYKETEGKWVLNTYIHEKQN